MNMTIALILAGGSGQRMGQSIPKQFLCVDNKPIFIYTLERFQACDAIDKICICCVPGWETCVTAYAEQFGITKLHAVVCGGATRFMSVYHALTAVSDIAEADDIVMTYDAVRPLITDEMIRDAIEKTKQYGAAVGVLPCYDSMYAVAEEGDVLLNSKQNRSVLYRGTGPDTVLYGTIMALYEEYLPEDPGLTVIEMLIDHNMPVAASLSSNKCIKLTTVEDVEFFHAMLKYEKYDWLR